MGSLAMSSQEVISSLRGKVLERPTRKISHGEHQRPCEIQHEDWTPYNSNLQMQGIKVVVINPVPEVKKGDAFEDNDADRHDEAEGPEGKQGQEGGPDQTVGHGPEEENGAERKFSKKLYVINL